MIIYFFRWKLLKYSSHHKYFLENILLYPFYYICTFRYSMYVFKSIHISLYFIHCFVWLTRTNFYYFALSLNVIGDLSSSNDINPYSNPPNIFLRSSHNHYKMTNFNVMSRHIDIVRYRKKTHGLYTIIIVIINFISVLINIFNM